VVEGIMMSNFSYWIDFKFEMEFELKLFRTKSIPEIDLNFEPSKHSQKFPEIHHNSPLIRCS
jgi:hypothetical protein